ncbi:Mitogen-activated protein kinase kinase kinase 5 [Bulinus truncatus]|nr:Mitogen-activated protein kinase kinase kinase 5 [Bulinus truncatus]
MTRYVDQTECKLQVLQQSSEVQTSFRINMTKYVDQIHAELQCSYFSENIKQMFKFDFKGDGTSKEKDKTNWEKKEMIGIGYYGRVYKGVSLENRALEFAVKEIESPKDEKKRKRVEEEIKNLSSSSHERIVQCYGTCFEESKVFIFMEYMSQGNLKDYIENRQSRMTENEVRTFTKQILEGVEYLHLKNTLHGDLKSLNVLLADDGTLKIADFGLSIEFDLTFNAISNVGTVRYNAPERLKSRKGSRCLKYSYPSDIWAVGCITVEMITRELPFPGLDPDPDRRPSARELLTFDPFIKGGVFKPLADCESESPTGQLVQSFSKLTVKLYVKKTSRDRPSSAPDKENSGRKRRRKTENSKRLGTGLVTAVYETIEGRRAFKIATDSSIIYDQIEAENSECTLYYDSVKNKGIIFKKGNFLHRHSERNVTEVEFIVRNEKILLEEEIETFRRCLKESSVQKKSVVMVSHPLGYPKHVSVGIIDDSVDVGLHDDGILRYQKQPVPLFSNMRIKDTANQTSLMPSSLHIAVYVWHQILSL